MSTKMFYKTERKEMVAPVKVLVFWLLLGGKIGLCLTIIIGIEFKVVTSDNQTIHFTSRILIEYIHKWGNEVHCSKV